MVVQHVYVHVIAYISPEPESEMNAAGGWNTQAADGLNKGIAPCKQMAMLGIYWTLPKTLDNED